MNKLKQYDQIFIIGITGSGKTFFANQLSNILNKKYYNFDMHWDYDLEKKSALTFLKEIENKNNIIIDGIPYDEDGTFIENIFSEFINYYNAHNVTLVCVIFEDIKKWIKTLLLKNFYNVKTINKYTRNYFVIHLKECYEKAINLLNKNCKNIYYYNFDGNRFLTYSQFQTLKRKIIKDMDELEHNNLLRNYMNMLKDEGDYDVYYQDIECIDFIGYSKSFKTWEQIEKLNIENREIFDIGCFHGYFTFKMSENNKFVYGVDISNRVLETCKILSNIYKRDNVEFFQWNEEIEIPLNIDFILCLNVLHHFKNQEKFLKNIKSGTEILFEIDNAQRVLIEKYFDVKNEMSSHRENRIILYCIRKMVFLTTSLNIYF